MTQAPETPTTQDLHSKYPLGEAATADIERMRGLVSHAINNHETYTVGIVGYCARPGLAQRAEIMDESSQIAEVSDPENRLIALHRGPMWKPRTKPEDWHGEETTDPDGAYVTMRDQAELYANLAVEIGHRYHLPRYGHLLSFMWTGGRNVGDNDLIKAAALENPTIPLGIKNGLDGTTDQALEQVARATELRGPNDAPVVLIYRGGLKASSPSEWEKAVIDVHEETDGRFLLDTAHGTEMAHDPGRLFGKSVDGQVLAVYAMNRLAQRGYAPAGSMMEASRLESPTDPHMPLAIALEGVKEQHKLKVSYIDSRFMQARSSYP
jgi:hypothetical protein